MGGSRVDVAEERHNRSISHTSGGISSDAGPPLSQLGAKLRARRVLDEASITVTDEVVRASHTVNEVWFAGPYVVRISPNRWAERLHHEASLARLLPTDVRYPQVVAVGRSEAGEWMITRRESGEMLSKAWPKMGDASRRSAIQQLAGAIRSLQQVPTARVRPPFLAPNSLECPHQLPAPRLLQLIERAEQLPNVNRSVLDQADRLVRDTIPLLDPPAAPQVLVHGDLHFENLLWDGARITAVLDFEWARPGPADLDLDVLLRFLRSPEHHVEAEYRSEIVRRDFEQAVDWLRADLPAIFAIPGLAKRLAVYALSYDVRALLLDPPKRPADQLPATHPMNRIRATIAGNSHF